MVSRGEIHTQREGIVEGDTARVGVEKERERGREGGRQARRRGERQREGEWEEQTERGGAREKKKETQHRNASMCIKRHVIKVDTVMRMPQSS